MPQSMSIALMKPSVALLLIAPWLLSTSALRRKSAEKRSGAQCTGLYTGTRGTREQHLLSSVASQGWGAVETAQFMAQCAHECDSFNTMEEYASGDAYEGRTDLGNIYPGDGRRYKGRGYIQLTGRANYRTYGAIIGVDLENNPTRASEPDIAAQSAIAYWNRIVKPRVSNFDDTTAVTRLINGGTNGLADRQAKFALYRPRCGGGGGSDGEGAVCSGNAGLCIDTTKTSCPRWTLSGLCPGGSSIKCCPSSQPGVGSPCSGVAGTCIDTSRTVCPRVTLAGRCPGGASIKCCPYDTTSSG